MIKSNKQFSLSDRIKSFSYAFNGVQVLFRNEHNARIHLLASIFAVGFSYYFNISSMEWVVIIFCIGFVFMAELFNSSIEYLADAVSKERNELIGIAKDLGAAGVLVSAIFSMIVGSIVFLPKILELL